MMNLKRQKYFTPLIGLAALSWLSFAQAATDCAVQTQIDEEECNALVDLYTSTNGANWTNNTGWNETNTPCSWHGVSCSGGHVAHLNLFNNQLSGSIPDSLGNLSNLWWLHLGSNQLSGSIPGSFGNLSNLSNLRLYSNQLSGSIPDSLGNLSSMVYLSLHNNQLSGEIPEWLGNFSSLWILHLHNNQLSGPIPDSLGNLSHLQWLLLYNNELCGDIPPSLMNLSKIYELSLNNNNLTASEPELIEWLNSRFPGWKNGQTPEVCKANLAKLDSFIATFHSKNVMLDWKPVSKQTMLALFCGVRR
jgi:hypothetical protein